jgi:hypothetical protein
MKELTYRGIAKMKSNKKILRGLQDIRTLSGRIDNASLPYKDFMKISCLEMEKFRRGKERESAMQRVKNIDLRLRDIEVEKASLIQSLAEKDKGCSLAGARGISKPEQSPGSGGLKLKY